MGAGEGKGEDSEGEKSLAVQNAAGAVSETRSAFDRLNEQREIITCKCAPTDITRILRDTTTQT